MNRLKLHKKSLHHSKFFFISLGTHLLLILGIFFYFTKNYKNLYHTDHSLPSYLTNEPLISTIKTHSVMDKKRIITQRNISQPKQIKWQNSISKIQPNKSNNSSETLKDKLIPELLALLHQQIAANQFYPAAARLFKQTGTVKIQFLLFPSGEITQATIIKSSGFASIDSSALVALKKINPVKEAATYLQKEQFFSVDIIFT